MALSIMSKTRCISRVLGVCIVSAWLLSCSSTETQTEQASLNDANEVVVNDNTQAIPEEGNKKNTVTNRTKGVVTQTNNDSTKNEDKPRLPQLLALMPLTSSSNVDQENLEMMRESIFNHLSSTNFLFVRTNEVDQRIQLLNQKGGFSAQDAEFLTGLLDVDGILLAEIVSSDITYVGVASHIYFKVDIKMVNEKGAIIWQDTFAERSLEGGVGADPFTLLYSLAVTALHAGKENVFAVTDKIGRMIATSIPQPEGAFTQHGLYIDSVVHDASNKSLKYGDVIKVGVKAPSNHSVNIAIEGINQLFNTRETSTGAYFVDIPVDKNWDGQDLMMTAYLVDKMGNRARKISSLGLIEFDNTEPQPPSEAYIELAEGEVRIYWEAPEPNLEYLLYSVVNDEKQLINSTRGSRVIMPSNLVPFSQYSYELVAKDKADNQSQPVQLTSLFLPNNAIKQAKVVSTGRLPQFINQDSRLTKANSPYLIDDITTIARNAMIFIEPGVIIEFTRSGSLNILGGVTTFGASPVIFRSLNSNQSDHTFITLNSQRHLELNGFRVTNAGIGIEVLAGKPMISNGEIINSKFSALSIQNQANVAARNIVINGSNTSAIVVANDARLSIKQSQFMNNLPFHIQNSSTYTIDATNNQWEPAADMMSVLGKVKY